MKMSCNFLPSTVLIFIFVTICSAEYYGKDLGKLTEFHHGVKGHVYAVDGRTLFIKNFHYDGEGPAAYFYVGSTKAPTNNGAHRIRDERGSVDVLKRYKGKDITLTLPEGMTLHNIKWFSVWCDEFSVNFGDVRIPRNFDYPKPLKIGSLSGVHGVSSDPVVIVDAQTLLIPNFSYDGEAPDAKFWVGRGEKPSPQGIRIADENGKMTPLRKYDRKTIVLTLPGDLTIFDIGHFGVWCEAFTVDFGHVKIPQSHTNVPPSLKMLGVSPQSKLNCEVLFDDLAFEVRWAVAGDSIVLQLVAKLEDGEYMSFGLSGDPDHTQMVGGDATVAWVDKETLKGYAQDYYLDAKSQCAGVRGSCPDEVLGEKTNSVRLLNAAMVNGYSIVTYQRPLKAADELDRSVLTNGSQPIIWAIGPLNSKNEVSYHSHFTKGDKYLEFGRPPHWNCPMPESEDANEESSNTQQKDGDKEQYVQEVAKVEEPKQSTSVSKPVLSPNPVPPPKPVAPVTPWYIPPIACNEPEDGVFYAQMGPTGGKQGYSAVTGHVGWGISWYINGLLIPEITIVRGKKYTFVVEGGSNPEIPAKYHPFYITDDSVGGYEHQTPEEKSKTKIFAGVRRTRSGELVPTGVGRSCHWTPDADGPEADEYPSFGAYQRTLTLVCEEGNPGIVTFTPDHRTPDTIYYQCFTHRYLGWKINVVDRCDLPEAEASENIERISRPDDAIIQEDLLEGEESLQVESRIKNENYDYKIGYNEIDSEKKGILQPYPDHTLTGEVSYNPQAVKSISQVQLQEMPLTNGQLKQVIETVEDLESKLKQEMENRPVYQHSTTPSTQVGLDLGSKDSVPERPVREDEEVQLDVGIPSTLMLPPDQKPLTLQSFLRPHSKPGQTPNQHFKKPLPPEIKHRRPVNLKPPQTIRHPFMPGVQNNSPFKKMPLKGPGQRYQPQNGYLTTGLPRQPTIAPQMFNQAPYKPQSNLSPSILQNGNKVYKAPPPKHHIPNAPVVVMAKPGNVQTLQIGQPALFGSHVVQSKITLPGVGDVNTQQSVSHPFVSLPSHVPLGQIIMGKPIENPMPLDQQMIQTRVQVVRVPASTSTEVAVRTEPEFVREIYYRDPYEGIDMKSSDFLGESKATESPPPMPTAINTGFKPETIVIESGFKPIIREPLMANEDRIADILDNNRREDINVHEEYEDELTQPAFTYVPSEKLTETFEPIFIPSPPDRHPIIENVTKQDLITKANTYEKIIQKSVVKIENPAKKVENKENLTQELVKVKNETGQKIKPDYAPNEPIKKENVPKENPLKENPPKQNPPKEIIKKPNLVKDLIRKENFPKVVYPSNHAKEDRPHPVYKKEYSQIMRKSNVTTNRKQFLAAENSLKTFYTPPSTTKSTTVTTAATTLKQKEYLTPSSTLFIEFTTITPKSTINSVVETNSTSKDNLDYSKKETDISDVNFEDDYDYTSTHENHNDKNHNNESHKIEIHNNENHKNEKHNTQDHDKENHKNENHDSENHNNATHNYENHNAEYHSNENINKSGDESYDDSNDYSLFSSLLKELNLYDDEEEVKPEVKSPENDSEIKAGEKEKVRKKRDGEAKSMSFEENTTTEVPRNSCAVFHSNVILSIATVLLQIFSYHCCK